MRRVGVVLEPAVLGARLRVNALGQVAVTPAEDADEERPGLFDLLEAASSALSLPDCWRAPLISQSAICIPKSAIGKHPSARQCPPDGRNVSPASRAAPEGRPSPNDRAPLTNFNPCSAAMKVVNLRTQPIQSRYCCPYNIGQHRFCQYNGAQTIFHSIGFQGQVSAD
jgi:hypothetical protein